MSSRSLRVGRHPRASRARVVSTTKLRSASRYCSRYSGSMPRRHRPLALLIGIGLGAVVNFLLATLYVYPRHSGAAGAQEAKARQ